MTLFFFWVVLFPLLVLGIFFIILFPRLLLWIILLPLLGVFFLILVPSCREKLIKKIALAVSLATFVSSLFLWILFNNLTARFQFCFPYKNQKTGLSVSDVISAPWDGIWESIESIVIHLVSILLSFCNGICCLLYYWEVMYRVEGSGITDLAVSLASNLQSFQRVFLGLRILQAPQQIDTDLVETVGEYTTLPLLIGVDGISLFFVILTTFLIPVCLLVGWNSIRILVKEYCICFLVLEALLIAAFSVLDLLLFYIFFESVLIPMFLIIGVWGSRERKVRAAYQLFLYTLVGSLLMLLAILLIYCQTGTTNLQLLYTTQFSEPRQLLLWLAFFASFAVKVPMIPVHIWLPEAHVEAPTAGSVILAGILLKLGTYGFLRFSIPLFPYASIYFTPLVQTLSVLAIIYSSLTTLRQVDLKKIIAYSSVAHMNFVTLGLFTLNLQGLEGGVMLMLAHGIVSPALFLLIGFIYDRHKTRILRYYGGCGRTMPLFALIFLFFTMANISLPGTANFVGEFLVLTGAFRSNTFVATLAASGMVLGAAYALWLCNRLLYGVSKPAYVSRFSDLSRREFYMILPFAVAVLAIGVVPDPFLQVLHCSVSNTLQQGLVDQNHYTVQ